MVSFIRPSAHLRGEIWGLHRAGWSIRAIAEGVVKGDGKHPTMETVRQALALRLKMGPRWNGLVPVGAVGKPRATKASLDKAIRSLAFKYRGRAKVDRAFVKKMIKAARKVGNTTISTRLAEAGLAWLRQGTSWANPESHFDQAQRILTSHFAVCGVGAPSMLRPSRRVWGETKFSPQHWRGAFWRNRHGENQTK